MSKHARDAVCPSCEEKLKQACGYMVNWFHNTKKHFPSIHISCSFRNQQDQEQAYAEGKTHAQWPKSPHNRTNDDGVPCSYALDLFELSEGNVALFPPKLYCDLWDYCVKNGLEIIWGGKFRSLGDADHFQYNPLAKT